MSAGGMIRVIWILYLYPKDIVKLALVNKKLNNSIDYNRKNSESHNHLNSYIIQLATSNAKNLYLNGG